MNIGGIYGEKEGTGDRRAAWLEEIRCTIESRLPPPTKRVGLGLGTSWCSAGGPDRFANFWWKHAHSVHEGVASAFSGDLK